FRQRRAGGLGVNAGHLEAAALGVEELGAVGPVVVVGGVHAQADARQRQRRVDVADGTAGGRERLAAAGGPRLFGAEVGGLRHLWQRRGLLLRDDRRRRRRARLRRRVRGRRRQDRLTRTRRARGVALLRVRGRDGQGAQATRENPDAQERGGPPWCGHYSFLPERRGIPEGTPAH